MLQRAASNAYSWWWASHIRTKQSKWLEQSLQDMEEKVNDTLNIIDDDGDSFAKRAEMYYRKRPELIAFVEESYKSYRALAERYDHLSRELQSVNRKIATAFPEEVQFDVDDDEEEEDDTSAKPGSSPEKQAKDLPDGQRSRIPKAPCVPGKDFRSPSMLIRRKGQLRRTPSYAKGPMTVPASGLSKDEATEEIDKLQKEILSLQTEKEFVKSVFKRGKERYWEIENQATEMQQKVCCLQDEFSIGIVIEDNEARTLMAATALKSCQEALVKLQERHRQSEEDVKVEDENIQEAYEKFQRLRGISLQRNEGQGEQTEEKHSTAGDNWRIKSPSPNVNTEQREKAGLELAREKMMEEIDAKVSVPELAEKIDDLVDKVVNLETEVSSQAAVVRRLRLETAVLQAHIQSLEGEKANPPTDGSEKMRDKLKEFEDELKRVKGLKQRVVSQCQNLLTHFTEASSNIASLSEKLESLNLGDEVEMTGLFREAKVGLDGKHGGEEIRNHQDMKVDDGDPKEGEDMKDGQVPTVKTRQEESLVLSGPCSEFDTLSEKPQESMQHDKEEGQDLFDAVTEITNQESEEGRDEDDQPNWKQLFLNGLEDTEKILLDKYTSVLRSYKDVKSKLNEVEKKNRDSLFELAMEIRELRNANAQKEAELESLHQKLHDTPGLTTQDGNPSATTSNNGCNEPPPPSTTTATSCKQPLYKLLLLHNDRFTRPVKCKYGGVNLSKIGKAPVVPTVEEKLRMEIDELMEENLVFWLRFSTSIHQIQKFQTTFHDLQAELLKLKDAKVQQEGSSNNRSGEPANSEVRPIYKHLREIQTEIKLWFEHNELLNEELQNRSMALRDIQDEISRVLVMGSSAVGGDNLITEYQAAKFQGEVLNMRQENKKVEDELRIGLDRVRKLQADIERTLKNLDADPRMSASRKQQSRPAQSSSSSRSRIPLRSFLFGVKLKKQKASLFSCASPALQKQYSDVRPIELPITELPT